MFFAEIWRECCLTVKQKTVSGNDYFFASLKRYDYFNEENSCLMNYQSLTALSKQTRQVIKISCTGVLVKVVKKT